MELKKIYSIKNALVIAMLCIAIIFANIQLTKIYIESKNRTSGLRLDDFAKYYILSARLHHDIPVYNPLQFDSDTIKRADWSLRSLDREELAEGSLRAADPPALIPFTYSFINMNYFWAWWSMALFTLAAIIFSSFFVANVVGHSFVFASVLVACVLGSNATMMLLVLNHIESIILVLGILGWYAFRRNYEVIGAMLWGLCAATKLFPALWIVLLFFSGRRRAAIIATGFAVLATMIAATIIGFDQILVFIEKVIPQAGNFNHSLSNHSLMSFGYSLGSKSYGWILTASVFLGSIFLVRRLNNIDQIWTLGVCASLACSPLSWSYYYVLLYPCVIITFAYASINYLKNSLYFLFILMTLFFWPGLLGGWNTPTNSSYAIYMMSNYVPLLGLLVLCWMNISENKENISGLNS